MSTGMRTGLAVSGTGHGVLLVWAAIGTLFATNPPPPLEVTEVTLITASEFASLNAVAPDVTATVAPPPPPAAEVPAPTPPAPEVASAPDAPEAAIAAPPPPPQAPRIAPRPAPAPPVEARPDDVATPATRPAPAAETEAPAPEPTEATAPEEATTRIVPEANDSATRAPSASLRPAARPARAAPADPAPEATPAVTDAIASAVSDALTETPAPLGPPLTEVERDALRLSVQRCWNVGALSSEAQRVTVTVAVDMTEDARPVIDSIRRVGASGGSDAAIRQAYETARRAIIICGNSGFDLPAEKYDQWREIEMTFNPEEMRLR